MINIKKVAIIINGFVHDFASGYWVSCMVTIAILNQFQTKYLEISSQLNILERFFFWNSIGAILIIFITGGMRTFTYVDNFYGKETEGMRRRMLVIKHILLFLIFGAGSFLAYRMSFY